LPWARKPVDEPQVTTVGLLVSSVAGQSIGGGRMQADEPDISPGLVRRLIGAQFPQWAAMGIQAAGQAVTSNAMFRLGPDLAVFSAGLGAWESTVLTCQRLPGTESAGWRTR
jgi:hypothetical protein